MLPTAHYSEWCDDSQAGPRCFGLPHLPVCPSYIYCLVVEQASLHRPSTYCIMMLLFRHMSSSLMMASMCGGRAEERDGRVLRVDCDWFQGSIKLSKLIQLNRFI